MLKILSQFQTIFCFPGPTNSKSLGTVVLKQGLVTAAQSQIQLTASYLTKVLLEHSNTHSFIYIVYGCFCPARK